MWPWTKQWFLRYDTKSAGNSNKEINKTLTKLKTFVLQCTPLRKWKDNLLNGRKFLQIIYLIRVFYLFIYVFFKHLYWSIIALQWCVSFCCITKWVSYTYTYIPISPPSCVSFPPSLSHPSRWSQNTELISLCYAAASHWLSILHLVVYICPCHSLTSSQLTLPPLCVLKFILYVCVFIPVLPLGSSNFFFFLDSTYMC